MTAFLLGVLGITLLGIVLGVGLGFLTLRCRDLWQQRRRLR